MFKTNLKGQVGVGTAAKQICRWKKIEMTKKTIVKDLEDTDSRK
jgi:hypothetical protein